MKKKVTVRKSPKSKKLIIVLTVVSTFLIVFFIFLFKFSWLFSKPVTSEGWENRYYTVEQLKEYNGTNVKKPIYMGYEGKVFDVSSGVNFYGAGKTYNYLVGKDSTAELNEVGVGEIIVRKYPVIGRLK